MTHENSVLAHTVFDKSARYSEILNAYEILAVPATDRKISSFLGYMDLNKVRPRITELIHKNRLVELKDGVKDEVTGKTVRLVRIASAKEYQQEFNYGLA